MATYLATLQPAGHHPTLRLSLHNASSTSCSLCASLSLPRTFIADRYQLQQLQAEGRLGVPGSLAVEGDTDLEAPVHRAEGAEVFLVLREAGGKGKGKEVTEWEVPLHMRYLLPVNERWQDEERLDLHEVEMDSPTLFWACPSGQGKPHVAAVEWSRLTVLKHSTTVTTPRRIFSISSTSPTGYTTLCCPS